MSPRLISTLAGALSVVLLIVAVIVPVVIMSIAIFSTRVELQLLGNHEIFLRADELTPTVRMVLSLFAVGYLAPFLVGILALRQTFIEAAASRWLSEKSVAGFRRFAWANLILVCYEFLGGGLLFTYVRLQQVPNSLSFAFGFTANFFTTLFIALAVLVAAQIFAAGQSADEENRTFV